MELYDGSTVVEIAVFAWEAYEKGTDAHVQADPTKLALLAREFNKRKDTFIETKKESILSKYGGEEHLDAPPKQLLLAQTVRVAVLSRAVIACMALTKLIKLPLTGIFAVQL